MERNDYVTIRTERGRVVLTCHAPGYSLKQLTEWLQGQPRIRAEQFTTLRHALTTVGEHDIGTYLPEVTLHVSPDGMRAEAVVHLTEDEARRAKERIDEQVTAYLQQKRIIAGYVPFPTEWPVGEPVVVARGREPVRGRHAVLTYREEPERRPVIREDGTADLYEMNFITPVERGEWLGEKELPERGEDGFTIFGETKVALAGEDGPLRYDHSSVEAIEEDGKIVLRARHGGALRWSKRSVAVDAHVMIEGDVGPETGSITFDGSVTVRGTVHASYFVEASGDVSIEGRDSVTNADRIVSKEGSVYIQGGVFGANATRIEAKDSVFMKHCSECAVRATDVHIGIYALGSTIEAERITVDPNRGKVIGGHLIATESIECAIAGNRHERFTHLEVTGTDEESIERELRTLIDRRGEQKERHDMLVQQREQIAPFLDQLDEAQRHAFEKLTEQVAEVAESIRTLDGALMHRLEERRALVQPRITVTKEAHPGVLLQIGPYSKQLTKRSVGTFERRGGEWNV